MENSIIRMIETIGVDGVFTEFKQVSNALWTLSQILLHLGPAQVPVFVRFPSLLSVLQKLLCVPSTATIVAALRVLDVALMLETNKQAFLDSASEATFVSLLQIRVASVLQLTLSVVRGCFSTRHPETLAQAVRILGGSQIDRCLAQLQLYLADTSLSSVSPMFSSSFVSSACLTSIPSASSTTSVAPSLFVASCKDELDESEEDEQDPEDEEEEETGSYTTEQRKTMGDNLRWIRACCSLRESSSLKENLAFHGVSSLPIAWSTFFETRWEAKPLHVSANSGWAPALSNDFSGTHRFSSLFNSALFPLLLSSWCSFPSPEPCLTSFGVSSSPYSSSSLSLLSLEHSIGNYICRQRARLSPPLRYVQDVTLVKAVLGANGTISKQLCGEAFDKVTWETVEDAFMRGKYTVGLRGVNFHSAKVSAVCEEFRARFGTGVSVNAYWTPPAAQGLCEHIDDHCVFVLQLEGKKRWKLSSQYYLPPFFSPVSSPVTSLPSCSVLLQPGDLLYIPRGVAHCAVTEHDSTEPSLHLSFGIEVEPQHTWKGCLHVILQRSIASHSDEFSAPISSKKKRQHEDSQESLAHPPEADLNWSDIFHLVLSSLGIVSLPSLSEPSPTTLRQHCSLLLDGSCWPVEKTTAESNTETSPSSAHAQNLNNKCKDMFASFLRALSSMSISEHVDRLCQLQKVVTLKDPLCGGCLSSQFLFEYSQWMPVMFGEVKYPNEFSVFGSRLSSFSLLSKIQFDRVSLVQPDLNSHFEKLCRLLVGTARDMSCVTTEYCLTVKQQSLRSSTQMEQFMQKLNL